MKLIIFVLVFLFLLQVRAGMEPIVKQLRSYSTPVASEFNRCLAQAYKYDTNPKRCID